MLSNVAICGHIAAFQSNAFLGAQHRAIDPENAEAAQQLVENYLDMTDDLRLTFAEKICCCFTSEKQKNKELLESILPQFLNLITHDLKQDNVFGGYEREVLFCEKNQILIFTKSTVSGTVDYMGYETIATLSTQKDFSHQNASNGSVMRDSYKLVLYPHPKCTKNEHYSLGNIDTLKTQAKGAKGADTSHQPPNETTRLLPSAPTTVSVSMFV